MKKISNKYFIILLLIYSNFISCSSDCEDMRPDLKVPDMLTPYLVQKYFNPYDYSGQSYKNEFYFSQAWLKNTSYPIPQYLMAPYLPFYPNFFPYYDPYNRFTITGIDNNNYYYVKFANGFWNQGGYIYYGQYNAGINVGDQITIYKYVFNDQKTNYNPNILSKECSSKNTKNTKIRIEVKKDGNKTLDTKSNTPEMAANSYSITSTTIVLNQFGNYDISGYADIDEELEEKDENNNNEGNKTPIKFGKNQSVFSICVKDGVEDKSKPFVTFINKLN